MSAPILTRSSKRRTKQPPWQRRLAAFQQVLANNFPARAAAIAGEIQAAGGPLLIGLQEAALISGPRHPPLDYAANSAEATRNPRAQLHDRRELIRAQLSVLPVSVKPISDIVLARTGMPGFTATGQDHDFRPSNFRSRCRPRRVRHSHSATRGYVLVDATLDGVPFQFVSTHLEQAFHTRLPAAQAAIFLQH